MVRLSWSVRLNTNLNIWHTYRSVGHQKSAIVTNIDLYLQSHSNRVKFRTEPWRITRPMPLVTKLRWLRDDRERLDTASTPTFSSKYRSFGLFLSSNKRILVSCGPARLFSVFKPDILLERPIGVSCGISQALVTNSLYPEFSPQRPQRVLEF